MKKKLLAALLAASMFATFSFTGCLFDDEDMGDDGYSDEGEVTTAESQNENSEDNSFAVVGGTKRGMGLVLPECKSEIDKDNPNATVKRNFNPIKFTPGKTFSGEALPESHYLYRETLNTQGKRAYDEIRAGIMQGKRSISVSVPISTDDAFTLFYLVYRDEPGFFYVDQGTNVRTNGRGVVLAIEPYYNDLSNDIPGNRARIEQAVSGALAEMQNLSEVEKIKYAHDFIVSTTSYDLNAPYNQNMYSTFANGVTVCAGYAQAFSYMMKKSGIPCAYVAGDAGGSHAWNILKGGNDYYMMDVTWDDPTNGTPNYDYFCITEAQIQQDHHRDDKGMRLPDARGTAYSYNNAFGGNAPVETGFPSGGNGGYSDNDNDWDNDDDWDNDGGNGGNNGYDDGYNDNDGYDDNDNGYDDNDNGWWDDDTADDDAWWNDDSDDWWNDDTNYEDDYFDDGFNWGDDDDWGDDCYDDDWSDFDSFFDDFDDFPDYDWGGGDCYNRGSYRGGNTSPTDSWWNVLDPSWEKSDWQKMESRPSFWQIYDKATRTFYMYDEAKKVFYAFESESQKTFALDPKTYEWVEMN